MRNRVGARLAWRSLRGCSPAHPPGHPGLTGRAPARAPAFHHSFRTCDPLAVGREHVARGAAPSNTLSRTVCSRSAPTADVRCRSERRHIAAGPRGPLSADCGVGRWQTYFVALRPSPLAGLRKASGYGSGYVSRRPLLPAYLCGVGCFRFPKLAGLLSDAVGVSRSQHPTLSRSRQTAPAGL